MVLCSAAVPAAAAAGGTAVVMSCACDSDILEMDDLTLSCND